jgi:hypothetical protein
MLQLRLFDIKWEGGKNLPRVLDYNINSKDAVAWGNVLYADMEGNYGKLKNLLHDVYWVESERRFGVDIRACKVDIRGRL